MRRFDAIVVPTFGWITWPNYNFKDSNKKLHLFTTYVLSVIGLRKIGKKLLSHYYLKYLNGGHRHTAFSNRVYIVLSFFQGIVDEG